MNSKNPIHTIEAHTDVINSIKFNEQYIVTGSSDSTCKVWDTVTGELLHTFNANGVLNIFCSNFVGSDQS